MKLEILKGMLGEASKDKPVTRQQIKNTFLVSDRTARAMIEELREQGVRVCGQNDIDGYWIAKTQEEYKRFRRDYMSKAATIFRRVQSMDNQNDEGQVNIFDLL